MASHTEPALNPASPTHGLSTAELYDAETSNQDTINRIAEEMALRLAWPRPRVLDYQQERLREILHHTATHSAYYRDTIGHLVESGAPLSDFPVMNKTTLMSEFDRIVTDPRLTRALVEEHAATNQAGHLLLDEYRVASTGGSSGRRGVFVYDRRAWDLTVANLRRMQRLMGLPPALRPVGIAAPSPVHLSNRFYAEMRAMFLDSPPLSVITPMEKVVEALNRYLPDSISTYPSFIRRLADEQVAGRLKIAPILMRSVAEALAPDVRDLVRATWNIPTTNSYASTEAGIMGSECREQSGIHLCDDMFLTEIVDDAYRPVSAGTTGAKVLLRRRRPLVVHSPATLRY
jgi:phenylacetate-CoA ligase